MKTVEVVEYDPSWPILFRSEQDLLCRTVGNIAVQVHHIGSTAVPGLAAKPIIDILVEVTDVAMLDECSSAMEAIGYEPKGEFGIPGRRYFRKGGDNRTHHIHAFAQGDSNITRHLAFRDYLRYHPDVASEYAQLKKRVAQECGNDFGRYCDGKNDYVKRIEALALQEGAPR